MNGQEERLPEDDVDLLGDDRPAVQAERERDQVGVPVGQFHLGTLVALLDVLGDEGMESELRGNRPDERRRRVDEVHPVAGRRFPDSVAERLEPRQAALVAVAPVLDPEALRRFGRQGRVDRGVGRFGFRRHRRLQVRASEGGPRSAPA